MQATRMLFVILRLFIKHAGNLHQVTPCFLGISQILCVLLKHAGHGHRCIQPKVLRIEFQRFLSKYIVSQI